MIVVVGNTRVADIYLGEFMRLYSHHAFRELLQWRKPDEPPKPLQHGRLVEGLFRQHRTRRPPALLRAPAGQRLALALEVILSFAALLLALGRSCPLRDPFRRARSAACRAPGLSLVPAVARRFGECGIRDPFC